MYSALVMFFGNNKNERTHYKYYTLKSQYAISDRKHFYRYKFIRMDGDSRSKYYLTY